MPKSDRELGTGGTFLEKLWEILSEPSNTPYINWQPDGLSFVIHDVKLFEANVLTKYFKHSNHNSFVRQLNMYSFVKTCNDSNYREFQNPLFQRERKDLMTSIKRKASAAGANSKEDSNAPKKLTEGQTSRQRAMIERQQAEEEAAASAKKRASLETGSRAPRRDSFGAASMMLPSPNLQNNNVSWDPKLALDPTLNGQLPSPWDPQYGPAPGIADSPFLFRMNSDTSTGGASVEPLLIPGRRNPEGINTADDFAFSRMNSLDPNNPTGALMGGGRPRSGSTGSYIGSSSSGAGGSGVRGVVGAHPTMEMFEDTKNRVRELETRNFLLTERFNELKGHCHQLMILLHTYFADTAAATATATAEAGMSSSGAGAPSGEESKLTGNGDGGSGGFGRRTDLNVNVHVKPETGGGDAARAGSGSPRNTPAGLAAKAIATLVNASGSGIGGTQTGGATATVSSAIEADDDQDHSPAAKALKATLGTSTSTASLGENIAQRNTQDAVDLIKGMRAPDARTTEGASNFFSLISSINRSNAASRVPPRSLAGQAIVKQASLPASFAPPSAPAPEPEVGSKRPREERSLEAGNALAGQPLKKLSTQYHY